MNFSHEASKGLERELEKLHKKNQIDLDLIKNSLTTNTPCQRCDVNANGIVDIYDVTRVSVKV